MESLPEKLEEFLTKRQPKRYVYVPAWVRHLTTCEHCHFEAVDGGPGFRWTCDAIHPEILAQLDEWEASQEDALWGDE